MDEITIRTPDDFHLHLRQGKPLGEYVRQTAAVFARAIVMPNILPPVSDAETLNSYRSAIEKEAEGFRPLMTFKILPGMKPETVKSLKGSGAVAGKLYPAGSTTNADDGISSPEQIREILSAMEEEDIVLSIHGEDPSAPVLEREIRFLPQLEKIIATHSRLRVVLEHISSKETLGFLAGMPDRVAGTITAHHLLFSLDDLIGGALQPHLFCKPVIKTEQDRLALLNAVLEDRPRLFFGSDSAPHPKENKECTFASAGVFSSPIVLPLLADLFDQVGAIQLLEGFVSEKGALFYGLPLNEGTVSLRRETWKVPELIGGAMPLLAGKEISWRVFS